MRVVLSHPLTGASMAPPQVSWQLVVIQTADGSRVIDPVLALARDNVVHFYQVLAYLIIMLHLLFDVSYQNIYKLKNTDILWQGVYRDWFTGKIISLAENDPTIHDKQFEMAKSKISYSIGQSGKATFVGCEGTG